MIRAWHLYVVLAGVNLLYEQGWPQSHRNLPVSASKILGLKVYATMSSPNLLLSVFLVLIQMRDFTKSSEEMQFAQLIY